MDKTIPETDRFELISVEEEIKNSYLDYAMSVIIGRALPDVRDGLKPVHRRVLFAMKELGNDYNKPYKKSARVVGDVIGKYHPHGDQAVYDTLVRLAQDFSMRYPLADGQGNFGSIDGDSAAAMRYTEVRLSKLAHEFMEDLDKKTVDFTPNYDGSLEEPEVMPAKVPGLLINGSSGIAVGMATNIPPHNLNEVLNGLVAMIDNPGITINELMRYIPGPDFPTRGIILGSEGIREAYHTGKGPIKIQAKASIETLKDGKKTAIVITELPYQVNKAKLVEKFDEMVREKKLEGISEIRDESDRQGLRVVLEIKSAQKDMAETILNQLFASTQLEVSFGINMLAIVNQTPRLLTLKEALFQFLEHRRDVVTRRTRFELAKAEARAHILEGLRLALSHLDEIIALIRASSSPAEAKSGLVQKFGLTEIQAQAILDLRLQKLTQLERQSIEDEYGVITKDIERYRAILGSELLLNNVVKEEFTTIQAQYKDARRTVITDYEPTTRNPEDFIPEEDMVVTISHGGYIKRTPVSTYKSQLRGGKGVTAAKNKEDDFVERMYVASTHSYLLFLTNRGQLYWLKVHEVPLATRISKGKALINVIPLKTGEKVTTVLAVGDLNEADHFVFMATKKGLVKRVSLAAFGKPRKNGIIALNFKEDDELVSAALTDGKGAIVLSTRGGKAICFKEEEIRSMGRIAAGVRGIKLSKDDKVVAMDTMSSDRSEVLMTVTENGYGKRTLASEYAMQSRGGKGSITLKTSQNSAVVAVFKVNDDDRLMLITNTGRLIMFNISEVNVRHRRTQGVRLMRLELDEVVVDVALLPPEENSDDGGSSKDIPPEASQGRLFVDDFETQSPPVDDLPEDLEEELEEEFEEEESDEEEFAEDDSDEEEFDEDDSDEDDSGE
ncbi:MAG: DNA gyrase subunit A [Deltaproteobacteria bacterium]|jgi:DNA gyrase subunit A|nr:DNA gyrase subunit A [Deltaproteobacteria bacterium]